MRDPVIQCEFDGITRDSREIVISVAIGDAGIQTMTTLRRETLLRQAGQPPRRCTAVVDQQAAESDLV
jgi:hypothetical protein